MRSRDVQYQLDVYDSLFNPYEEPVKGEKRKAYYRKIKNQKGQETVLYKVWLCVDGPDLPFVDSVTYHLHPTFPNPVKTVMCSPENPKAAIHIWTWGIFTVEVTIKDIRGRLMETSHYLTYDRALRDENIEWIEL